MEMYAFYEFAVHAAVRSALTAVRGADASLSRTTAGLQSLILDGDIQSCAESGKEKKWTARTALFTRLQSGKSGNLNVELFPTDGSHYRRKQLETIWGIFGVKGRVVPDGRLFPLIEELVERRNAVAHGRERPEDIGRRYTNGDIRRKFGQSRRLCKHILTAVEKQTAAIIASSTAVTPP